jgi:ribosomal protein S18 acetylase RimI-like enzyme
MDISNATADDLDALRALLREYAESLGTHICFQAFDRELADLPGEYAPPRGRLLVARDSDRLAGCVALRPLPGLGGELKRLYVRPAHRGTGLGRRLAGRVIEEAAAIGYARLFLDTLPSMTEAAGLYRALGFRPVEPYLANPVPGAVCMALAFQPGDVTTGSRI